MAGWWIVVLSGPNAWTRSKLPPPSPSLYRHRFKLLTVRGEFCALRNEDGGCTERRFGARDELARWPVGRHYAWLRVGPPAPDMRHAFDPAGTASLAN
jgi:hypothetical protein